MQVILVINLGFVKALSHAMASLFWSSNIVMGLIFIGAFQALPITAFYSDISFLWKFTVYHSRLIYRSIWGVTTFLQLD